MPRTSSAIAAFCAFDRTPLLSGRPRLPPIPGAALSFSQQSGEPPESAAAAEGDRDWFFDGQEAARHLKMELGIIENEKGGGSSTEQIRDEVENKTATSDAILESGRAAARELLKSMAGDIEAEDEPQNTESIVDALQAASEQSNQTTEDHFNLPARKSHCMTVCFVPPPSATNAWEQLTEVRRECKDPGFYRWPPHANILYPFLEPVYEKDGENSKDVQRGRFRAGVARHLAKAAEQCNPFDVTIDSFGTFDGKQRGVTWAYPKSKCADVSDDEEEEEPLIALQRLLEEQFPMCNDQRKAGAFRPHLTLSHYANNDSALAAKKEVELKWEPVSFHVPEVYLLERKGDDGHDEVENKTATSDAILESGRAAARELLKSMAGDIEAEDEPQNTESIVDALQAASEQSNQTTEDHFNLPARKSHCMTVCFVPPPSATNAWEQLTEVRRECKDPGFYRWPPHANILYPFLEPVYEKDGENSKDVQRGRFRAGVARHLAKAAEQCNPFDVTIDSFGTFDGKQRGVTWAYPKSKCADVSDDEEEEEPLIALQRLLEEQFPMCNDQRKAGAFRPHLTLSHYANNDSALAAKKEVELKWEPVSFHVPEVYLLERKGDDGQFNIVATIPLGPGSQVEFHDPPMPFPAMPEAEEEWVFNERMAMKERRKKGNRRRKRRGGRGKESGRSSDEDKNS
ncbi:hypothetical protein ACHAXT_005255 [Thalassiosira profunda]